MPKKDNVGYGDCTKIKMEHFSSIIAMHLAITQAVLNKNKYYLQCYRYIDLTAGKGFSPTGDKGSPIIFLEQAESGEFQIPYRADFIEKITKNLKELEKSVQSEKKRNEWIVSNIHFHRNEYQVKIPLLLNEEEDDELGLVFVDPSGELPDFDCLRYIAKKRPRMEILIYISSTNVKRIIQYTGKRLSDYIGDIGKRHWLIREAINWDQFKWTFLLGSNAPLFKDYRKINFYRLESQRGQKILEKLDFTKKERREAKQYKMDI